MHNALSHYAMCEIQHLKKYLVESNQSLSQTVHVYCVTQPKQKTFKSKIKYICHVIFNLSIQESYTGNYRSFQNKPVYPFSQFSSFQKLPIKN